MKDIVIIGAGGFGREVQWLIERINEEVPEWNILGYIDDAVPKGDLIDDIPVLGTVDDLIEWKEEISVACAIGASHTRRKIVEKICKNKNLEFPNLIDPSVIMSKRINMGGGNIICAGNILTVDIKLHDFNIFNLDCTIGHDVQLDSFDTLYPSVNVSGCVCIGAETEIGTGTQIIQGVTIGKHTIVGAGAVVIKDLPSECTAVGVPAKPIYK